MARQWHLRSKLLLGLGLVVGSVGLLVAGTVLGLTSYVSTMNTADSKVAELAILDQFKAEINPLNLPLQPRNSIREELKDSPLEPPKIREKDLVMRQLQQMESAFQQYQTRFKDTIARNRDPDPYQESNLIPDIQIRLEKLKKAIEEHYGRDISASNDGSPPSLPKDPKVLTAQHELIARVDELRAEIVRDMYQKIDEARRHYRKSLWIVIAAASISMILTLTLLHLFQSWLFRPLKELRQGVQRVFRGDFQHPIELNSGDELEELATAFNETTQKLHHIYQDLERKVDERSRQLVRSERMVSVGFLAAGVAHEINNPLASIAFCSEALQSRLAQYLSQSPRDTEVIGKYLSMIQQEAFRCKGITSKLLEFSRVGDRRREPTDLAQIIQSVLEMAQHLPNCRGKRIMFQPLERVVAGVNAEDIKSVILNLVVNALDSLNEGGVITITLQQRENRAEMIFVDTGCGMPSEVLQNIFEPFFTKSRTGKGTGLGLFISHQIIDQHGGEISAASAGPNQGSTFTVRLPIQAVTIAEGNGTDADSKADGSDILAFSEGRRNGTAIQKTEDGIGHAAA